MSLLTVTTARSPFSFHSQSAWLQFSMRCWRHSVKCAPSSFVRSVKNATTPSLSFRGENTTNYASGGGDVATAGYSADGDKDTSEVGVIMKGVAPLPSLRITSWLSASFRSAPLKIVIYGSAQRGARTVSPLWKSACFSSASHWR